MMSSSRILSTDDLLDDKLRQQQEFKTGELLIPTSYGHIAAKTWQQDSPERLKVLAVHGWQDNAGTFDRLFPLLPIESMYIVAIDLPGHGSSSHLPKGVPYTDLSWVIAIKNVLDHLGWTSNVTIIAHSMGANASLEVAALYPEIVERLIMIDTIKHRIFEPEQMAKEMANSVTLFSTQQRIPARPNYSFDSSQAIDLIIQTHYNGKLTKDGAFCLMQRAVDFHKTKNGQVVFKRDARLNCIIARKFDQRQLLNYLSGIKCQLMIIRARNTHHTLRCGHEKSFLDLYRKKCQTFKYCEVEGDHYVHLTNPSNISSLIIDFLRPAFDTLKPEKST